MDTLICFRCGRPIAAEDRGAQRGAAEVFGRPGLRDRAGAVLALCGRCAFRPELADALASRARALNLGPDVTIEAFPPARRRWRRANLLIFFLTVLLGVLVYEWVISHY